MNLGKLLGLGKSFFGSDPAAAYRLNRRACLPKFNEGKNPFSPAVAAPDAPPAPKIEKSPAKTSGLSIAQAVALARQNGAPAYAFKPILEPASKPAIKAAAPAEVKPAAKVTAKGAPPVPKAARPGWTTRLNPFRAPEPAREASAVQSELSLDAVKVVHNDLADADVEVVPVKSHAPEPAMLPPARQAWEYMGENLLKSS